MDWRDPFGIPKNLDNQSKKEIVIVVMKIQNLDFTLELDRELVGMNMVGILEFECLWLNDVFFNG